MSFLEEHENGKKFWKIWRCDFCMGFTIFLSFLLWYWCLHCEALTFFFSLKSTHWNFHHQVGLWLLYSFQFGSDTTNCHLATLVKIWQSFNTLHFYTMQNTVYVINVMGLWGWQTYEHRHYMSSRRNINGLQQSPSLPLVYPSLPHPLPTYYGFS